MSEAPCAEGTARMQVSASDQVERSAPPWLAEVAVYAQVWAQSGLLEKLEQRVHVPRGRMGTYVECDFVLPTLSYASSGERTLKDFYERLEGFEAALAGLWGRKAVASRSALSRFHAAVEDESLEALRAVLLEDLLERGIAEPHFGGLIDRQGQRHVFFDVDGTKQPGRQRRLCSGPEYPPARRRLKELCAPARLGRKRGEVGRTRTVVQHSHTGEWLGSFGGAGNGQMHAELRRSCEAVRAYMEAHKLKPSAAVVRLDGLYGYVPSVRIVSEQGLGFLARCADYRLLEHLELVPLLEKLQPEPLELPDSGASRQLYDVGPIHWHAGQGSEGMVPSRLLVSVRAPGPGEEDKPRIGKRLGQHIYELFVTDRSAAAFSASDLLSLYLGRGAAEGLLGAEDRELEPDRLVSTRPCGQEWYQLLSQWVWNERLRLGAVAIGVSVRRTLWAEARATLPQLVVDEPLRVDDSSLCVPQTRSQPPAEPTEPQLPTEPQPPAEPTQAPEPPSFVDLQEPCAARFGTVVAAKGRGAGRFAAGDFQWLDPHTLLCPAGKPLHPHERRVQLGQRRIRFEARAADCRSCDLALRCLGGKSSSKRGRRVSVIPSDSEPTVAPAPCPTLPSDLPQLPARSPTAPHSNTPTPRSSRLLQPASCAQRPPLGSLPLFWDDLPSSLLRTFLPVLLLTLRFDLCLPLLLQPLSAVAPSIFTRDQRAHRRLTFSLRLARNALPSTARPGSIHIHGLPRAVSHYLAHPARAA
jgi:hypothetical protein